MHLNNTYSLKAILQSDLDPTLCKLMLHQIKSPLLQHSFQLTTDDQNNNSRDFSTTNFQRYQQNQKKTYQSQNSNTKRQQVKQQSRRRMDKKLDQISVVHSRYEPSRRQQHSQQYNSAQIRPIYNQQNKQKQNKQNKNYSQNNPPFILNQNQYLVSPLQIPSNSNNDQVDQFIKKVQTQIKQEQKLQNGVAKWCGEIFDPTNAFEKQIVLPGRFVRRKIFQNRDKSVNKGYQISRQIQNLFTFKESINKLRQIQQQQVASFLELLSKILTLLKKSHSFRINIGRNENKINKMLIFQNPVDYQTKQTISNKERIINRLKVQKMSQAIHILKKKDKDNLQESQYQNQIFETDIARTLQLYSQIQDVIEDYVSKGSCVVDLHKIYNLLYQKQIKQRIDYKEKQLKNQNNLPSPISSLKSKKQIGQQEIGSAQKTKSQQHQNWMTQQYHDSLKQKLQKLFISLRINPDQYNNLGDLVYIWSQLNSRGAYSPTSQYKYKANKQKFIGQLCKNDILIHQAVKGIAQLQIQRKLTSQGFKRNIEATQK